MAEVDFNTGKRANSDFTQAIATEKHERIARRSLQDIMVFYQAIETEMQCMTTQKAQGGIFDADLFTRMSIVKDHYKRVMTGFLELDDNSQRHALITFADATQDLMKHIHVKRSA